MSTTSPAPTSLSGDADGLTIVWSDGVTHRLSWRTIREQCPCATCRTKQPEEPPASLPVISAAEARPIRARGMQPVGNYAYAIDFTDGHNTGIYTVERLREIGEAGEGARNDE